MCEGSYVWIQHVVDAMAKFSVLSLECLDRPVPIEMQELAILAKFVASSATGQINGYRGELMKKLKRDDLQCAHTFFNGKQQVGLRYGHLQGHRRQCGPCTFR